MLNRINLVIIIAALFYLKAETKIISAVDSINYYPSLEYLQLKNKFLIESSLEISKNDSLIIPNKINIIEGKIFIKDSKEGLFIIKYDYLEKKLPIKIGPEWKNLPDLDKIPFNNNYKESGFNLSKPKNESNIYSSGNIFRSISFSPLGGSDFTGGLQMQVNGSLANNINVSGILSDQNLTIQPEGTTSDLENFDKIFINITHPNFLLDAGDIEYIYNDKYNNINRKLVGLKNNFNYKNWSGTSVYANSKGISHFIEIKGRDGDQGPYELIGKDGKRDIVILAGTEKIWFNGKRLKRGENYDYTIDYSLAEIHFTPRIIVDFDSDIYIEYQYSDFKYQKGFNGISLQNTFDRSGYLSFGLFNEFDQFNKEDLGGTIIDSFLVNQSSLIKINTAYLDSIGEYILEDSIYIYSPKDEIDTLTRYRIIFQYNSEGKYEKTINETGEVFYKHIPFNERLKILDRYSPFKIIKAPKSQQFGLAKFYFPINEYLSVDGQFSGSREIHNIMTENNDSRSSAYIINVNVDTVDFKLFKIKLSYQDQQRNPNYISLGRETHVNHTQLWNIDKIILDNSRENQFQTNVVIKNFGTSSFESAKLLYDSLSFSRFRFNQNIFNKHYKNSFLDFNYVNTNKSFYYRTAGKIERIGVKYSPNISFVREENNTLNRYQKSGLGINYNGENSNIESGFNFRTDEDFFGRSILVN